MDPNATLVRLRLLAEEPASSETFEEIRELWQALDNWITSGGFLPAEWDRLRIVTPVRPPETPDCTRAGCYYAEEPPC